MIATLEDIYEQGVLRLASPLPLPEHAHVRVTVQSDATAPDSERAEWASASQAALMKTWDNSADDVFNELNYCVIVSVCPDFGPRLQSTNTLCP